MKKVAESCPGTTTNLQAGNTSQTGTNVLHRTLKNTPPSEPAVRGFQVYESDLPDLARLVALGHPDPKALIEQGIESGILVVV